jgi:sugar phosphate isomerase/epimerase
MDLKIGVMNDPRRSVYDEAAAIGRAGYDFLDLTLEGPAALKIDVDRLADLCRRHGLAVVGHTDPCLPWAYPLKDLRRSCLGVLEQCARIFRGLGAEIMNIHPCYICPPAMKPDLTELNLSALPPVVRMARNHGLEVVIENFVAPFDRVAVFQLLMAEVPGLKMHLDVGHTNLGGDGFDTFLRQLGPRIRHVHFSDNRGNADHHMPLGVGNIRWPEVISALKNAGYSGTVTLEAFCGDPRQRFRYLEISRDLVRRLWQDGP